MAETEATNGSSDVDARPDTATAPPDPEAVVPANEPGEVGRAMETATPGDDLSVAASEGSISAGEGGSAADADVSPPSTSHAEVIIGKIPDAHETTKIWWTARCTDRQHDLLGHFESEDAAVDAKQEHLTTQHS